MDRRLHIDTTRGGGRNDCGMICTRLRILLGAFAILLSTRKSWKSLFTTRIRRSDCSLYVALMMWTNVSLSTSTNILAINDPVVSLVCCAPAHRYWALASKVFAVFRHQHPRLVTICYLKKGRVWSDYCVSFRIGVSTPTFVQERRTREEADTSQLS